MFKSVLGITPGAYFQNEPVVQSEPD
jgi:hypothetical protein